MKKTISKQSLNIMQILMEKTMKIRTITIDSFSDEVKQCIDIEPCRDPSDKDKEWVSLTKEGFTLAITSITEPMFN